MWILGFLVVHGQSEQLFWRYRFRELQLLFQEVQLVSVDKYELTPMGSISAKKELITKAIPVASPKKVFSVLICIMLNKPENWIVLQNILKNYQFDKWLSSDAATILCCYFAYLNKTGSLRQFGGGGRWGKTCDFKGNLEAWRLGLVLLLNLNWLRREAHKHGISFQMQTDELFSGYSGYPQELKHWKLS